MTDAGDLDKPEADLPSPFSPPSPPRGAADDDAAKLVTSTGANAPAPIVEIGSGDVSGVAAFWGDADEPLVATLSFRIGQADETLRTRGMCKLVAQLATSAIDDPDVDLTTSVNPLLTSFTVTGPPAQAGEILTRVSRNLAALPTEQTPNAIAEIQAAWSPPQRWDIELLTLRYGTRGYGLPACEDLGLHDLDPTAFDNWQRTWFTAGNAVLICNRQPPAELNLMALPDGFRKALPDPHPLDLELPAVHPGPDNCVAVSFLTRIDATVELALGLIVDRLRDRFAQLDTRIGDVDLEIQPTGEGQATVTLFIPVPNEFVNDLREAMSSELFRFAMTGPEVDELDLARAERRRSRERGADEGAQLAALEGIAFISGREDHAMLDSDASPTELATAIRMMLPHAIWLLPRSTPTTDHRLTPILEGSELIVEGNPFPPVPEIAAARRNDQLIVGSDGLTLLVAGAPAATVRFDDIVAVQRWSDRARTLWGDDGIRFLVHESTWLGGGQVIDWVDSQVEAWLVIEMNRPSGYVLPIDPPPVPTR